MITYTAGPPLLQELVSMAMVFATSSEVSTLLAHQKRTLLLHVAITLSCYWKLFMTVTLTWGYTSTLGSTLRRNISHPSGAISIQRKARCTVGLCSLLLKMAGMKMSAGTSCVVTLKTAR